MKHVTVSTKYWLEILVNQLPTTFYDQELIPYCYTSSCCWGDALQKNLRLCHFRSEQDEFGIIFLHAKMH